MKAGTNLIAAQSGTRENRMRWAQSIGDYTQYSAVFQNILLNRSYRDQSAVPCSEYRVLKARKVISGRSSSGLSVVCRRSWSALHVPARMRSSPHVLFQIRVTESTKKIPNRPRVVLDAHPACDENHCWHRAAMPWQHTNCDFWLSARVESYYKRITWWSVLMPKANILISYRRAGFAGHVQTVYARSHISRKIECLWTWTR